eukprot:TRINITY_DN54_c1_g1_i2.p1 TRINITY_DN54_c1_g1~~TRINITY_DN54_c1_g1_i2.p1  ORF type:complete len:226 (-),score=38.84 TRINITY_DN54_c1_g1_i2:165-842(-)
MAYQVVLQAQFQKHQNFFPNICKPRIGGKQSRCHRQLTTASCCSEAYSRRQLPLLIATTVVVDQLATSASFAEVCEGGIEGKECRQSNLSKDAGNLNSSRLRAQQENSGKITTAAGGIPVPVLDDEYSKKTLALADTVEKYISLDVYDRERLNCIKLIKSDGGVWVSKYARGGSARKDSARRMYIIVDALGGFFAQSGAAPLPAAKARTIRSGLEEVRATLASGK